MKNSLKVIMGLTLVMYISGCSGSKTPAPKAEESGMNLVGKTVYIRSNKATYSPKSHIAKNIKDECKLDTQMIKYIQAAAKNNGMTLKVVDSIPSDGLELKIEITDAISSGNMFIGHRKFASISGSLTQGAQSLGSFEAARRTSGGMFAGFKSSCAVLGRAVKVLGQDTAKWMKKPSSNAELGDVRLIPRN